VYGSYAFPVGMGIEAEVSTSAPSGFSPGRDLRLYVFAGFDSFGGPASAADPARETPAIQRQGASCYTPFNAG
jgi:hypothetical protein